jgi:hypothetical protein
MTPMIFFACLWSCSGDDGSKDTPTPTPTPTPSTGDTGGSTITDPACALPAMVDLGTGQLAFEPLPDGAPLGIYFGPQGGYHVFISVKATGIDGGANALDPNNPVIDLTLTSGGTVVAQLLDQPRQLVVADDGVVQLIGQLLVFSVADPPSLGGDEATLDWSLTDRCDRVFEGSVEVLLTVATE